MKEWLSFIICLFFFVKISEEQYQQCTLLSGKGKADVTVSYGESGIYASGNSPGGIHSSESFFLSDTSEILVFFGSTFGSTFSSVVFSSISDQYSNSDQIWKFSTIQKQWMFVKGRKLYSQKAIFNQEKVFETGNEIGSREGTKGFKKDGEGIITFFGGYAFIEVSVIKSEQLGSITIPTNANLFNNEMWQYDISQNMYSVIRSNNLEIENGVINSNLLGEYTEKGEFHESNWPSGRNKHEIIKLSETEVLLVGGIGYINNESLSFNFNESTHDLSQNSQYDYLSDWWIFSMERMEWKFAGESINSTIIYGETNQYSEENSIGARAEVAGTKINEEEALIFGGLLYNNNLKTEQYSNVVQKYNITSNYWKYVSGEKNNQTLAYGSTHSRIYSDSVIGGRCGHKLFKINEQEILVFGGIGFTNDDEGYLNSEFMFDFDQNKWKFTGKEISKYPNRHQNIAAEIGEYSDDSIMGSMAYFVSEYNSETKELFICNGYGFSHYGSGTLSDCFKVYYQNICFAYQHDNKKVCSSRGECVGYNTCVCEEGFFGEECQLWKCGQYLSNNTNVCNGNGVCLEGICYCDRNQDDYLYMNEECIVDQGEKARAILMQYVPSVTAIFLILIIIILVIVIIMLFFIILSTKQKKKLEKFEEIDDIEIVLQEQKISKNEAVPHFKINKQLFEIDSKDIKIISKIGQGGSSAVVYSAEWNKQKVAYKCFIVEEYLGTKKFQEFEKEVEILASISFPFILKFYGATLNTQRLGFVMEFAEKGDLDHFLKDYKKKNEVSYPLKEKLRMLKEIGSSMLFLHKKKIIHRDLKLQNVLITDNEETKLMDFGLSKLFADPDVTKTKKIGTPFFMSPEVVNGQYSFPCDVYSFAILTFIVLTENYSPYGKISSVSIMSKIASDPKLRPQINELSDERLSKTLKNSISQNWDHNPSKRMIFEQIIDLLEKEIDLISK